MTVSEQDGLSKSRRSVLKKGGLLTSGVLIAGCSDQSSPGGDDTSNVTEGEDPPSADSESGDTDDSSSTSVDDVTLHGFKPWNIQPVNDEVRRDWNDVGFEYYNVNEFSQRIGAEPVRAFSGEGHYGQTKIDRVNVPMGVRWDIDVAEEMDLIKVSEEEDDNSLFWEEIGTIRDYTLYTLRDRGQGSHLAFSIATKPGVLVRTLDEGRENLLRLSIEPEPIAEVDSRISTMVERLPERMKIDVHTYQPTWVYRDAENLESYATGASMNFDSDSGGLQLTYVNWIANGNPELIRDKIESNEIGFSTRTSYADRDESNSLERDLLDVTVQGDFVTAEASYREVK